MSETNTTKKSEQVQQTVGAFRKAFEDHLTRMTTLSDEVGKLEMKGVEQAGATVDEMSRMARETIAYGAQLASEWRRLSLEATRRSFEMFHFGG